MAGTVILTGANSSLGIPAVEHLLTTYPDFTSILTVRVDSESDPNTARLHATVSRFPNAKTTIVALDLSNLRAVHAFADEISSGISSGQYPPLAAVIANAYYWNLVGDPELTSDGFDKTIQISYISHAALVLRLIGNFGAQGRVILLSSDAHYPGKNPMEKYPPTLPNDLASLVGPTADPDKQGRGFQRYATAKLAMTTWMYSLNDHLQQVRTRTRYVSTLLILTRTRRSRKFAP
jgi:NAD(P)-dependent dehydrogenase (short-subunit alcohol dehydrogenase family)